MTIKWSGLCACGCGQPVRIPKLPRFLPGHALKIFRGKGGEGRRFQATHGYLRRGRECAEFKSYQAARWRYGDQFRFESFREFFATLGPRPAGHRLFRIDKAQPYRPGNVAWAPRNTMPGSLALVPKTD